MDYSQRGLLTLRRRVRWIVAGSCVSMAVALAVSWASPKIYRATTYVLISESKVNPDLARPEWDFAFVSTYIQFVDNDALATEAVKRFHLDRAPYKLTPHRFLQQSVDAQVVKNTRLLQIDVDFPEATLAADLANYMANGAAEINAQINDSDTVNIQNFLKSKLEEASARLLEARKRNVDTTRSAHIEDRERQLKVLLDEKEQVSRQVEDLRSALVQSQQRSASLAESLAGQPRTVQLNKTILSDRFLERALQSVAPGSQNALSASEEEVNPTRQELERELAESRAGSAGTQAGVEQAVKALAQIDSDATALTSELAGIRGAIEESEENLKLAREGYETATHDYRNASVNATARSQTLKPVSPAIIPEAPIRPRILLNTLAAGLLSVIVCAGLALGLERARQTELHEFRVTQREDAVGRYP